MHLLLRCRFWDDAVGLLERRCGQDVEHVELFHAVVCGLLEANQLRAYSDRVWRCRPNTYTAFELLAVLRDHFRDHPQEPQQPAPADSAAADAPSGTLRTLLAGDGMLTVANLRETLVRAYAETRPSLH